MQKQPPKAYELHFEPQTLSDQFPVALGQNSILNDSPITQLHLHDTLEVGYCLSGSGVFVIENKIYPFQKGSLSVINENEFHFAQSTEGTHSRWVWININPIQLLGTYAPNPLALRTDCLAGPQFQNILSEVEHPEITLLVSEIINEMRHENTDYQDSVRGLIWSLMIQLHRLPGVMKNNPGTKKRMEITRIGPALQILASNYMRQIEIIDLARACHMSLTHFRRTFKIAVGKSPLQYLTHLRIQMASSLLTSTNRSILDISLAVGYITLSSFNRHFKSVTGISPREWRKKKA